MRLTKMWSTVVLCAGLAAVTGTASASALSFQGTFQTDDQLAVFSFVAGPTSAIMRTWSFAGGLNANGDVIAPGGFDPVLSLFGPDSLLQLSTPLLATINDGGASVPSDPGSGEHFDSFIDTSTAPTLVVLTAGQTYFLVLSVSDNAPNTNMYGGGFSEQGNGNFTGPLYGCGSGPFCDIDVDQRDSHWAVDITGVTSAVQLGASSPEPGTFWLLGCTVALGLGLRRMSRLRQTR